MAKPKPQTFLAGSLLYVLLFAGSATETIGGSDSDDRCGGVERWEVKVMADEEAEDIDETPIETTIAELHKINTKLKANKYQEDKPRMEIEKQVFTIKHCFISKVLRENDNDLHLVIEDGEKRTIIAEIPDTRCSQAKNSPWVEFFRDSRATMMKHRNNYRHFMFTVTGVLFVDKSHGQTGRAPNNVELHPILEIKKEKQINPILQ